MQVTPAATLRPAAAHALRLSTDHCREGPKIRVRFGSRKLSWTETLDDATSLTRATGRQRRHSSILKVSCWAAAHHQHNSNPQHFKATGIRIAKTLHAFYQFCRPHTIFGTIIGITSVSLLPVKSLDDFTLIAIWGFLEALVAALCMNVYVVGLNQIFDIEIDKVNKPTLPLASGEFSVPTAVVLVVAFLVMSISIGIRSKSAPLMCALLVSFLLGSAYSIDVPLLRWKRHAFLAAFCIIFVRAVVVQLAFFAHMQQHVLKRPLAPTRSVVFATFFMCCFAAVIALFKDIPDVDGDRDFGIQSMTVRLGQQRALH